MGAISGTVTLGTADIIVGSAGVGYKAVAGAVGTDGKLLGTTETAGTAGIGGTTPAARLDNEPELTH